MRYVNVDRETRVWPFLQDVNGRTVELASGETVELVGAVSDPYLKPVTVAGSEPPVAPLVAGSEPPVAPLDDPELATEPEQDHEDNPEPEPSPTYEGPPEPDNGNDKPNQEN